MALISKEDNNVCRLFKAMNLCGSQVLYKIFCWGTPGKPCNMRLDEYLNNLPQTSSANYLSLSRKYRTFYKRQMKLIDSSPDGTKFDMPLLVLSIKLACENVAHLDDPKWIIPSVEMEYYITAVKNIRNDILHNHSAIPDEEFFRIIRKLREALTGCLRRSGERYGRDEAEVDMEINQMNNNLDLIISEILGEEDIIRYSSDDIRRIVINDSCYELKKFFQNIIYINPVSFFSTDLPLKVDNIFVDIEVRQGKRRGEGEHIDYRDLLSLVQTQNRDSCAPPKILVLEGMAGSGKTTLLKLLTQEWSEGGQRAIKDLVNYELLLWVQCGDSTRKSYQDLLDCLIPDVSSKFRNLLPRIIKLCKVLILIDGLDELNNNSRELVKSLLQEFRNCTCLTFMCTSRPETVEMFMMMIPEEYEVTYAELLGIKKKYLEEFVRLTHQEITRHTMSNRNTEKLVNKIKLFEDLQEHLRLPSNLTYFVYSWDQRPDDVNTMTITKTELYQEIHRLRHRKLLNRLKNKDISENHLEEKVQIILRMLYKISLESLSRHQLTLDEAAEEQLISACNAYDLPYNEILSAFMSLKPIRTWQGVEERYSAPHQGIHDYFSALHIVMTLKDHLQSSALHVSIEEMLKQSVRTTMVNMAKYNNVLVHVAGLLPVLLGKVPVATTQEIVRLVREANMNLSDACNVDQWLHLIENTKCNKNITREIARFINTEKPICIKENQMLCCKALFPHLEPSEVHIDVMSEPDDVSDLLHLLDVLTSYNHHCIGLALHHHYLHDDAVTTSDKILQRVQPKNYLMVFRGHLSDVTLLPSSLMRLYLAIVSDDHARHLLPQLHSLVTQLEYLDDLAVRIPAKVTPEALQPLPKTQKFVEVVLSGVSDAGVSHACDVVHKLQPPKG
ncbi:uncharacterized protein [Cherax quadricarinatus]